MIAQFTINTVEMIKLEDGGKLMQMSMTDASSPASLRTSGTFVTYLSAKARKELADGDLTDTQVTMNVREIGAGRGGSVKVKGDVVSGIKTAENMAKKFGGAVDFDQVDLQGPAQPATPKSNK